MRDSGQERWWRRTGELAGVTIAGALVLALAPWLLSFILGGRTALGLPLPYFVFVVLLPLVVLAGIFWFSRRQLSLDHRYDVTGTQD